jgi:hypothetical protein
MNIPRVTEVLQVFTLPAILKWQQRIGEEMAEEIREEALGLGTKVDGYVMSLITGEDVVFPEDENRMVIRAVQKFEKEWLPHIEDALVQVTGTHPNPPYTGTADLLCVLGGEKWLIDVKVAKEVRPTYVIQLSAYSKLDTIEKWKPNRFGILLFSKKGGFWELVEVFPDETHFDLFLSALKVYQYIVDSEGAGAFQTLIRRTNNA